MLEQLYGLFNEKETLGAINKKIKKGFMKIEICACFINYSIKSCLSLCVKGFLLACSSARRLRKNSISSGEWKLQKEPSSL